MIPPSEIDGATVLFFTAIDDRHRPTGKCRHFVSGQLQGPAAGLAICRYDEQGGAYLFYCDEDWQTITDTFYDSVEEAKRQAELEYDGVAQTWQSASSTG